MKNAGAVLCGPGYLCPFCHDGRYLVKGSSHLKWPYDIANWRKQRPAVKRTFFFDLNRKFISLLG